MSKGEGASNLARWLGFGAAGQFCQMTASDTEYSFTNEDRAAFEAYCSDPSSPSTMMRSMFNLAQQAQGTTPVDETN